MKERLSIAGETPLIDRLADAAARRTVPDTGGGEALIREALIVGRARARAAAHRRALRTGAAVALVLLAALAWPGWREPDAPAPSIAPPGVIELAMFGHRVEALDGARVEAIEAGVERSVWRLEHGAALFDVAPSGARGGFEVRTPDASVRVLGTVFAVSVEDAGTRVEVFEGRVEVRDERGARVLDAGESYATRASVRAPEALALRGERAARRRAARRTASAPAPIEHAARDAVVETAAHQAADTDEPEVHRTARSGARAIDLAGLRALCERGEWAQALEAVASARVPRAERGEWAMLEGDAHRALGHSEAAASAYERAAETLTPTRAALAGFLAATQRERAGQPAEALAVLEQSHAADRGSPLEERALAMRASLLSRVGRTAEARTAARAYLAAFPGGEAIPRMESLARAR